MHDPLDLAHRAARDWLDGLNERPVGATAGYEELRRRFGGGLHDARMPAADVVRHLVRDSADGLLGSAGGRFFAWVIGGSTPSALAADWLVST
jgi:hypothetical protein